MNAVPTSDRVRSSCKNMTPTFRVVTDFQSGNENKS